MAFVEYSNGKIVSVLPLSPTPTLDGYVVVADDDPDLIEFYKEQASNGTKPLTTRQFLIAAANAGIITWEEAASSSVPAAIQAVFDALPEMQRNTAIVTWNRMTVVSRNEPLVIAAASAFGMTDEQIDEFFQQAAAI